MDTESIAQQLNGYLLSLRRLSGNCCDFWCFTIKIKGSLQDSLEAYFARHELESTILSKASVGYAEVETLLQQHLLSKLEIGDEGRFALFAWDIVEHVQMSYRDLEPEADALHSREAVCLSAHSRFHGQHIYIVVPVKDRALVIALGTRA